MTWRDAAFDWNHARAFLAAAEGGSFSAAARALSISQPTIGRQVAALEAELGVTLFERLGASLSLTRAGADLADHVRTMREAAAHLARTATGQSVSLEGSVCITASELIAAHLLPPILARIRAAHPGIEIEIVASNAVRDLRRREADIAVRNVKPAQSDLVAKKIADRVARPYATAGYLASIGRPTSLADLARAEFFGFDRTERMIEHLARMGVVLTAKNFPIVTENHLVQWELAKQGVGICFVMDEVGDREPRVKRVLPEVFPALPVPIWLAAHRELATSQRIRVVFDFLAEGLARSESAAREPVRRRARA